MLPLVFSPRSHEGNFRFGEAFISMLICMNAFLVAFFYSNTEIFIPKLLAKRKALFYSLTIIGCLLIYMYIPRLFEDAIRAEMPEEIRQKFANRMKHFAKDRKTFFPNPFKGSTAVFFFVFTISSIMKVMQQWRKAEKKQEEIEQDKVRTELSFLKSQINPHFLFNTLNNIYSLALVKSDSTAGAVLKLSSIMRYVLNETRNNQVPLRDEIRFIEDFIELQKMRLTDKVEISFMVEGAIENTSIAPLLLIPFVENAFKYGISAREKSVISLRISVSNSRIHFHVINDVKAASTDRNDHNGIGLKNARRRLELLYPGKHELVMQNTDGQFIVNLILHQ